MNLPSLITSSGIIISFVLKTQLIKSKAGPVIKVVTNAIITIMVKTSGVSTFKSKPIFKTTNSIKPRVFIKAPMVKLSRQFCPTNFAANALPKNFPTTATRIIKPVTFHKYGSLIRPICVRNPVNTKNSGSNNIKETSSTFSINTFLNLEISGIITPVIKAPKRA